jgi:membrane protein
MIVSLIASAALAALGSWWNPAFGDWTKLAALFNTMFSIGFLIVSFALIYRIIPRVPIRWGDVWLGATLTALLFSVGKLLIGLYIGRSSFTSTFGAAASFAVLLVWVYYAAQIFLLGAEFTCIYAYTHGSLKGKVRPRLGTLQADPDHGASGMPFANGAACQTSSTRTSSADLSHPAPNMMPAPTASSSARDRPA